MTRATAWDLDTIAVTVAEANRLKAAGVSAPTVQQYALWRRSVLLLAALAAGASAASAATALLGHDGRRLTPFGWGATLASTLTLFALPVAGVAAFIWTRPARTYHLLVACWVANYLVPFAIAFFPIRWWFAPAQSLDPVVQSGVTIPDALGGLRFCLLLGPAVLSLLPGLIHAAFRVKTLLPAAVVPGWFLAAATPLYLLLVLAALALVNQVAGSGLLLTGATLWLGAMMCYVLRVDLFTRPLGPADRPALAGVHRRAQCLSAAGVAVLFAYGLTAEVFGLRLIGLGRETSLIWLWERRAVGEGAEAVLRRAESVVWVVDPGLVHAALEFVGRSLFTTVVFAELLMRMNLSVWRQGRRFAGTPAGPGYDAVMHEIDRTLGCSVPHLVAGMIEQPCVPTKSVLPANEGPTHAKS